MKEFLSNIKCILQKKQKQQTVGLIVLMVISAVFEVCGISSILPVISALLNQDFMYSNTYAKYLCAICHIDTYAGFVITSVFILLFIFLIKDGLLIIKSNYQSKFALQFQYELRQRVFNRYLKKDYSYYFENNTSEIYRTLMDDVGKTYASFDGLLQIITDSIVNIFLVAAIFVIDWRISLGMVLVIALIFLMIALIIRPVIRRSGEVSYAASRKRDKWIHQALQGIKTVKITEKHSFFEEKSYSSDLEFSKAEQYHMVLSTIPKMIIELFSIAALVILIVFLVFSGDDFALLIPKIGAIGMAVLKLLPGANSTVSSIVSMQYRMSAIRRMAELVNEKEIARQNGDFPLKYNKAIKAENISFRYSKTSEYILNDASISIPIGNMIGIVGTSGEGKTTFADILLGLLPVEKGNIYADEISIYQNIGKWRESIGYITQNVFLLDDSVKTNVAFGIPDDISDEQVWKALDQAQLSDFVRSLPEGINTRIGEKGVKLSGGQCQRVGIARALYNNPQILIFDEATSSLDTGTERDVVDAINNLYGEHTIIVIAHKSVALERCDCIYRIENGRFIKQYKN